MSRKMILTIGTAVVVVLICGIFAYIYLQKNKYTIPFNGQYLTATVPEGWQVKEITTKTDDNVSGLGNIEIWHDSRGT